MKKGVLKALSIYLIGFGLAWIVYAIYGHPYIHAPGFHHLILFFTLLLSFFWTLGAILFFLLKKKSTNLKAFIITNLVVMSCFIFYVYFELNEANQKETFETSPKNEIITNKKGDTTFVYHNGNIVYMKVRDSIMINFLDNIKIEE